MCYDISFKSTLKTVGELFPGLKIDPQLDLDFDRAHVLAQAFAAYPVVIFSDDHYRMVSLEWGVIADYMNTPEKIRQGRAWMCNAQSEKVLGDKRSYWHRIRNKRCLIPVTGIYEHREIKGWKKKVPYLVHVRDRPVFCIPGLYHYPLIPDPETGEITGTFTLITRPANEVMRLIHNGGSNAFRMPLFLTEELEKEWLRPDLGDDGIQRILDFEIPAEQLGYHPVYTIRSPKPRPDNLPKYAPFEWEDLPALE